MDPDRMPPPDPTAMSATAPSSVADVPPGGLPGAPPPAPVDPGDTWSWQDPPELQPAFTVPQPGRGGRTIVVALVAALIGGVIGTAGTLAVRDEGGPTTTDEQPSVQSPVIDGVDVGDASVVSAVAAAVTPSVASVETFRESGAGDEPLGLGSAVIYRSDGYLLTNHHVVEGGNRFQVRLANGDLYDAELVGSDQLTDLAVLKLELTGLPAISIRAEPAVAVGETAIAIGSPFGLHTSVTAGVVSAL
ncbi:MAG TPA: trypsin-like peptidase domain-containing protein, partial [Nitriliruptorales bacterium]